MSDAQADKLRKRIEQKYALAEKGDYFGLLGIERSATGEEIRKAYFALVKDVHPDRVGQLGLDDVKGEASKLFQIITQAYNTLSDSKKREQYLSGQISAATPSNPMTRGPAAEAGVEAAKIAFHKGSVMLSKRAYQEAETYFREATLTHPSVARYWQALGWAIFNHVEGRTDDQRLDDARKAYEKALELDEEDAQTHYNIGLYWKAKGDHKRTKRAMELAVEHKPNFIEAKRELRLMEMRSGKGKSKSKDTTAPADTGKKGKKGKKKEPQGFFGKLMAELTRKR